MGIHFVERLPHDEGDLDIAHITDVHHVEGLPEGQKTFQSGSAGVTRLKLCGYALEGIAQFRETVAQSAASIIINAGDLVEDKAAHQATWDVTPTYENFDGIRVVQNEVGRTRKQIFYLVGNHDRKASESREHGFEELKEFFLCEDHSARYISERGLNELEGGFSYFVDRGNYRLIFLETPIFGDDHVQPFYRGAPAYLSPATYEWLEGCLQDAHAPQYAILFSHHPVAELALNGSDGQARNVYFHTKRNRGRVPQVGQKIDNILSSVRNTVQALGVISGHVHEFYRWNRNGMDHVTLQSLTENMEGHTFWQGAKGTPAMSHALIQAKGSEVFIQPFGNDPTWRQLLS